MCRQFCQEIILINNKNKKLFFVLILTAAGAFAHANCDGNQYIAVGDAVDIVCRANIRCSDGDKITILDYLSDEPMEITYEVGSMDCPNQA